MKISKGIGALVVAGVFAIPSLARAIDWPTEFDLLTPKGAAKVERINFAEDGLKELLYIVSRPYPEFAVAQETYAKITALGWAECKRSSDGWLHYVDSTDTAKRYGHCVYASSRHFVKDTQQLSVLQERRSKFDGPNICPVAPDNAEVNITVVFRTDDSAWYVKLFRRAVGAYCP